MRDNKEKEWTGKLRVLKAWENKRTRREYFRWWHRELLLKYFFVFSNMSLGFRPLQLLVPLSLHPAHTPHIYLHQIPGIPHRA